MRLQSIDDRARRGEGSSNPAEYLLPDFRA
jgi:hypothetical protein